MTDYDGDTKLGLNILIYGQPKTGKTYFASTLPSPVLFMVTDVGAEMGLRRLRDVLKRDIHWASFFDSDLKIPIAYTNLETFIMKLQGGKAELVDGMTAGDFNSVVLDSASGFNDIALARTVQLDGKTAPFGAPARHHRMGGRQYFEEQTAKLLTLPHTVCITTHQLTDKDEDLGVVMGTPLLVGQLSQQFGRKVSEIYHLEPKLGSSGTEWRMRTRSHPIWQAGSNWAGDLLPEYIENDFREVWRKVMEQEPFWK